MPSVRAATGMPICCEVAITISSGISLMVASNKRNAMTRPLITRPVQTAPREMDGMLSRSLFAMALMVCAHGVEEACFAYLRLSAAHRRGCGDPDFAKKSGFPLSRDERSTVTRLALLRRREIVGELVHRSSPALRHAVECRIERRAF